VPATGDDFLWLHLKELPFFRALLRSVEARLYQNLDLRPPVLDLGSGDGHFASVAFGQAIDVGVDPSSKALREAMARSAYRLLLQAEGGKLPLRRGSFASIFSNSVLEHIPDIDAVLRELLRVARPGGRLVFTVPNPGYRSQLAVALALARLGMPRLAHSYGSWFNRMSRVHHLDGEEKWIQRLEKAGFARISYTRYFSPAAMRVLEIGHFLGLPSLVARWLTGRWILWPSRANLRLTEASIRLYYDEPPSPEGTFTLYVAHKE